MAAKLVFDKVLNDYILESDPIPWSVYKVTPNTDFSLLLSFSDGSTRIFNFKPLLSKEIYSHLSNINEFMKARAVCGTVGWENDIDIAPEYLYENSTVI